MILKTYGERCSHLSQFSLVGKDELALAKIFAFVLSKDKEIFASFLKICGINVVVTNKLYLNSSIKLETSYDVGRTDIEIDLGGKEHIIIETKINNNKVQEEQLDRYQSINSNYHIVLITSKRELSKYTNITWDLLLSELNKNSKKTNLFKEFYGFYQYEYYRRENMQEILIQDLAMQTEVERYKKGCIYKGHLQSSYPLYFAPYFARKSGEQEGITTISKVLFIMQTSPKELTQALQEQGLCEELKKYANESIVPSQGQVLLERWTKGIQIPSENKDEQCTYYFLDFPQELPFPLLKDKNGGKGWISKMIPINRTISFDILFSQIKKQSVK